MDDRQDAEALARRLGTYIPAGIEKALWSLPLLEVIVQRLEALEARMGPDEERP